MKRIIFIVVAAAFLNGCAQYTSMLGPVYTIYTTGNVAQAGTMEGMTSGALSEGRNQSGFVINRSL